MSVYGYISREKNLYFVSKPIIKMPSLRGRVVRMPARQPPPGVEGAQPKPPSLDSQLMHNFQSGGSFGGMTQAPPMRGPPPQQHHYHAPPPVPQHPSQPAMTRYGRGALPTSGPSDMAAEIKRLKEQVASLTTTVSDWQQVLSEITESVFPILGTCTVDNVPYYTDPPEQREALRAPIGHVEKNQIATLIYPQITRCGLLFMRIRTTCPRTGELQQHYVPVANQSMSPSDLYEYTGINTSAFEFFQGFHGPGEPNPGIEDDANE